MNEIAFIVIGAMFAAASGFAFYRIVRGPALLDRMIASDMLVTTIICVLGAEMVYNDHTRTIPIMVTLALVAIFASVTVARYVSKQTTDQRPDDLRRIARGRDR